MKVINAAGETLDAELDVEPATSGAAIVLHARYGGRNSNRRTNSDYFPALELLLERLGAIRGIIDAVSVDSKVAQLLPSEDRLLDLDYPLVLSPASDFTSLRLAMTRKQRLIAREATAQPKGGNNHKKIRIVVDLRQSGVDMSELARVLITGAVGEHDQRLGTAYRAATPDPSVSPADLFTFDASSRERGLAGHAYVQNALAAHLRERRVEPRSARATEPDFDLAWEAGGPCVAEIKSLTGANEDHQLRLGLGQVLHYRHLLSAERGPTRAVLAVEHAPRPPWQQICADVGVTLTWPPEWPGMVSLTAAFENSPGRSRSDEDRRSACDDEPG